MQTASTRISAASDWPDAERQVREDLAACYRLIAHFGWDDLIYTHISARVPGQEDHFLINPYGMTFDEITASSLIEVDFTGRKLDNSPWPANEAGFVIHSAVHMGRPSSGCVIHLHTCDGVAVSAMDEGLVPLNQMAIAVGCNLAYHEYQGPAFRQEERDLLLASLRDKTTMILRNHGTLAVGATVAEAFLAMYMLERSCAVQVRSLAGGRALHSIDQEAIDFTRQIAVAHADSIHAQRLVWPAMLRLLDRAGANFRD